MSLYNASSHSVHKNNLVMAIVAMIHNSHNIVRSTLIFPV